MQNVLPNACGPLATLGLHDPDYQGHSKMLVNVLQLFGPYDWSVNFLQWDWLCVNANVLQKLPQTLSRLPPANSPINSRSNVWVIPFGNAAEDNPKPVNGRVSCFLKPKPSPGSSRDSAAAVNTSHPDDVPLCSLHVNGKKSPNFSTALNGNIPCLSDSNTWRKNLCFHLKVLIKKQFNGRTVELFSLFLPHLNSLSDSSSKHHLITNKRVRILHLFSAIHQHFNWVVAPSSCSFTVYSRQNRINHCLSFLIIYRGYGSWISAAIHQPNYQHAGCIIPPSTPPHLSPLSLSCEHSCICVWCVHTYLFFLAEGFSLLTVRLHTRLLCPNTEHLPVLTHQHTHTVADTTALA